MSVFTQAFLSEICACYHALLEGLIKPTISRELLWDHLNLSAEMGCDPTNKQICFADWRAQFCNLLIFPFYSYFGDFDISIPVTHCACDQMGVEGMKVDIPCGLRKCIRITFSQAGLHLIKSTFGTIPT